MPVLTTQARLNIRDFLLCLSVSNLLFLRRWYDIETLQSPAMDYFRTGPAQNTLFWATLASIAIATALFYLVSRLVRRYPTGRLATFANVTFLLLQIGRAHV